jgi:hypothetical protein
MWRRCYSNLIIFIPFSEDFWWPLLFKLCRIEKYSWQRNWYTFQYYILRVIVYCIVCDVNIIFLKFFFWQFLHRLHIYIIYNVEEHRSFTLLCLRRVAWHANVNVIQPKKKPSEVSGVDNWYLDDFFEEFICGRWYIYLEQTIYHLCRPISCWLSSLAVEYHLLWMIISYVAWYSSPVDDIQLKQMILILRG